ncbi:LPS assembly lipoprotein LptE [Roseovarius amoyensis]|uniref:LPS assembly lipoprotein LptE n=1 Tax=Roseovarius amoyensis TaxID=2211448 RepID=UPI000DBE5054|nr:LPS assembly lipoprotein LptE [Roseovarius amoyensis]
MSWYNRRLFLISAAALAGCGFTPAFAPGGAATRLQGRVLVDEPDSRPGYLLTRRFEERLGRANPAEYGLSYSIGLTDSAIAVSSTNVITRYNKIGTVTWALRDLETDKVLTSGKAESFTSYSASGTTVASQAAERDAETRLMAILTDQIITRLIADAEKLPT